MTHTQYDAKEKVWRAPDVGISYSCLGTGILEKLKNDDPKRILEVHHDSGTCLTVEQIRMQTIAVAQNLMQMGLKQGDVVVLYSNANTRVTPISYAAYILGLQINFFETTFNEDEIVYELGLLDPNLLIYEEEFKPQLFSSLDQITFTNLKHMLSINSEADMGKIFCPTGREESFRAPDLGDPTTVPAALMFTSGSTGYPKIVVHSHALMLQGVCCWWNDISSSSIIFCFSPLRWISQVLFSLMPVFRGARRVYTSKSPDGQLGVEMVRKHKVTHFFGVTSTFVNLIKTAQEHNDCSALDTCRKVMTGGEYVSEAVIDLAAKVAPKCRVMRAYGLTEVGGVVATDELITTSVNGGLLVNGLEAKIVDDNGCALSPGVMGCICLRAKVPFLKYMKNEEANRESYLEEGWLNTGDYGFMDSNNLLNVVTRYKYLVRSGNKLLIPNVVEKIMDSHPGVQLSVLVGRRKSKDDPNEVGTVFIVLNQTQTTTENDLKEFMKKHLTEEQLQIIKHCTVVSTMPLTSCGKVDRIALKNMARGA